MLDYDLTHIYNAKNNHRVEEKNFSMPQLEFAKEFTQLQYLSTNGTLLANNSN